MIFRGRRRGDGAGVRGILAIASSRGHHRGAQGFPAATARVVQKHRPARARRAIGLEPPPPAPNPPTPPPSPEKPLERLPEAGNSFDPPGQGVQSLVPSKTDLRRCATSISIVRQDPAVQRLDPGDRESAKASLIQSKAASPAASSSRRPAQVEASVSLSRDAFDRTVKDPTLASAALGRRRGSV